MTSVHRKSLMFSSLKMSIATFSSRILGLVREQVMAHFFGANELTDAFLVAYRIPNLLRDLFAEGAFSMAFVPTFTEARLKGEEAAQELLWSLFIWLGLITGLIGFFIFVFAPQLVELFAPEFTNDTELFMVTVNLTKIMSPFLFLVSLTALFVGALNTMRIFFVPALTPAIFNLISIVLYLTLPQMLTDRFYNSIYALGFGVTIAGIFQGVPLIHLLFQRHFRPVKPKTFLSPLVKKVFKQLGPGMIGIAATQINLLVTTMLATSIVGAVSWLNYAFRLFQFPVGVLSVSLSGSNLVHFSELWKKGDKEGATKLLEFSYFLSNTAMCLAMCGLVTLSTPIVNIIFEHGGKFHSFDTTQTSLALQYYSLGLPFYGLYKLFVPIFYAMDRQGTAIKISLFSVFANIIFCSLLVKIYGHGILAMGTSLSIVLNACLLSYFAAKFLELPLIFFLNQRTYKILIATALTLYFGLRIESLLYNAKGSFFVKGINLSMIAAAEVFLFLFLLLLLGENALLKNLLKKIKINR